MTIIEAIEKAIEGGWRTNVRAKNYPTELALRVFRASKYSPEKIASFMLDPTFWRALGKTEGWEEDMPDDWRDRMHALIDHLTDGGTIESYFQTL